MSDMKFYGQGWMATCIITDPENLGPDRYVHAHIICLGEDGGRCLAGTNWVAQLLSAGREVHWREKIQLVPEEPLRERRYALARFSFKLPQQAAEA